MRAARHCGHILAEKRASLGRLATLAVILAVGCGLSFLAFAIARRTERDRAQTAFEARIGNLASFMNTDIVRVFSKRTNLALEAAKVAYAGSDPITREEFETFRKYCFSNANVNTFIVWAPRVSAGQRASFEQAAAAEDGKAFFVLQKGASDSLIRAGRRPEYFPVRYIAATGDAEWAPGFDLGSETLSRMILEKARDTADVAVHGIIPFRTDGGQPMCFMQAMAIYRTGRPIETIDERRENLRGFVLMATYSRLDKLGTIVPEAVRGMEGAVYAVAPHGPEEDAFEARIADAVRWDLSFDGDKTRRTLLTRPLPEFIAAHRTNRPWKLLAIGLTTTLLVAGYLIRSWERARKIERLVSQRTAELGQTNALLENKIAEHREAEDRFRMFLDTAPDAVVIADQSGNIVLVNSAAEKLFDYEREELAGKPVELLMPERFRERHREQRRNYMENPWLRPMADDRELYGLSKNGREFEVEISLGPLKMGGEYFVSSIIRDVSRRKQVERALRESEARYRLLAENVSDVIWIRDLNLNLTYISPSITRQRGWTVEEAMAQSLEENLAPISRDKALKHLRGDLQADQGTGDRGERYRTTEFECLCKDGTKIWTETKMCFLRGPEGRPIGILGISRDITERKKAAAEKAAIEEQLRQTQKMEAIGTLAGGIAHDFNNLLGGILGYANMLKLRTEPASDLFQMADTIERAADRAAQLTQQLLGFARKGKLQRSPVDLDAAIDEVVSLLGRTLDKNIEVARRRADAAPYVLGDPGQLQQVILNLAVNARDAMPAGGQLAFETEIVEFTEHDRHVQADAHPGRYVLLSVRDTGTGIPPEFIGRIFEPFFTTKGEGKGTGMGLAMVYGIVKNHGGLVRIYSELGRGSVFKIFLPLAEEKRSRTTQEALPSEPQRGSGRVLVVDDEPVIRQMAADMLGSLGYEVVLAADGQEAVDYYKEFAREINVVILDMIMPRMGGRDCYRALKQINPAIRAILSTGYGQDGAAQEILDEGMTGFIQKPYVVHQLSRTVHAALAREGSSSPEAP